MPEIAPTAPPLTWSRVFPATRVYAREARQFLADLLDDEPSAADAVQCLAELVANSLLHSRSREAGGTFTVRVRQLTDRFRVEVDDQGGPWQPRSDDDDQHGRGLAIVGKLSADWGVNDTPSGRTAWFEMP